jgi:hypothetical protein
MTLTEQLAKSLASALRYIEVQNAYKGAMTAAEVEAAILKNRTTSRIEIGANSCNTLASFNLSRARELIAQAQQPTMTQRILSAERSERSERGE